MILTNPKDGATLETMLTEEAALEVLKKSHSNFAKDLAAKYPSLSAAQRYWFFKLAHDEINPKFLELACDLEAFIRPFGVLQFKVGDITSPGYEDLRPLGKIKFWVAEDCVVVFSGEYSSGKIKGNKFYPTPKSKAIIGMQIGVFALDPVAFLELFGKLTGTCCICGRLLTNEVSVERGIGPICADKYGI